MQICDVTANGHSIQISGSFWRQKEIITHDGKTVSEKKSYQFVTPHRFVVEEDGEDVTYEVAVGSYAGYMVLKNGRLVKERHRPFLCYLTAFGFLIVVGWLLQLTMFLGALLVRQPFEAVGQLVDDWWELIAILGAFLGSWWLKALLRRRATTLRNTEEP